MSAFAWIIFAFILPIFNVGPIKFGDDFAEQCITSGVWFTCATALVNLIFKHSSQFYLRKYYVKKSLQIIHETKMPSELPKVVYVYTSHNDFMPSRLLQNIKQDYKNIEVWISDGSTKPEIRKEVVDFAKKHNVRLYQMPESGSKNKADNLNNFLKHSGVAFDYFLTTDADEALHPNYVNTSIRFFYSNKFQNLAFVSCLNQTYPTKSVFSNVVRYIEDIVFFFYDVKRSYSLYDYANLYSASCLISNDFLKSMGMKFPDGCLEDVYSEIKAATTNWGGIINPLTVSTQAFDRTIKANHARLFRIQDWTWRLLKKSPFAILTEKNLFWALRIIVTLFIPFIILFCFVAIIIGISAITNYWDFFLSAETVTRSAIIAFSTVAVSFLYIFLFQYVKVIGWRNVLPFVLIVPFWVFSMLPKVFHHWFNCFVLSKYSEFGGSEKRYFTKGFMSHLEKIKWDIAFFVCYGVIVSIGAVLFWYFGIMITQLIWFSSFIILFGSLTLSYFSIIFLYILSIIPWNPKYDPNDFIKFKNDFITSKKNNW